VTPGSISTKIITFFIILAIEVICNIIAFFYDGTTNDIVEYDHTNWEKQKYTIFALALLG
jgi:hypothetical protein